MILLAMFLAVLLVTWAGTPELLNGYGKRAIGHVARVLQAADVMPLWPSGFVRRWPAVPGGLWQSHRRK